jgi:hypothetical protein
MGGRAGRNVARVGGALLRKGEERLDIILTKFEDAGLTLAKHFLDIYRGAITKPDPDDFRGKSEKETSLMKIGVLRHDDELVIAGKFPDYGVICVPQPQ